MTKERVVSMRRERLILVTGASRGLGRAMATGFTEQGHTVLGCSRSVDAVQRLSDELPDPSHFAKVDVSKDNEVGQWANSILDDYGAPDVLVNNAALINSNNELWEVPPDEFSQVIDVNIKGIYHVVRHFVPAMITRGTGIIVNFSSGWGRSTAPEVAPYCASKWAVEGLTRALADELPRGMAAVTLSPGAVHTEMLESCFGSGAAAQPSPKQWAQRAVPFILDIGPHENGQPLTCTGHKK